MYVRVATFEQPHGDVNETIDQVKSDVESNNRPPGLEDAKGMMMLVNRETGKGLGVALSDSEEANRRGHRRSTL